MYQFPKKTFTKLLRKTLTDTYCVKYYLLAHSYKTLQLCKFYTTLKFFSVCVETVEVWENNYDNADRHHIKMRGKFDNITITIPKTIILINVNLTCFTILSKSWQNHSIP
jgi:hypothetical protein